MALLLLSITALSCGTNNDAASEAADGSATPPSEELTGEKIAALAESARNSAVSLKVVSTISANITGQDYQSVHSILEWTAPDRQRLLQRSNQDGERSSFGQINIGERSFIGWGTTEADIEWQESQHGESSNDKAENPLSKLGFSEVTLAVEETLNGVRFFKLTGTPSLADLQEQSEGTVIEASQTSYVTVSDFRTVRIETHVIADWPVDPPSDDTSAPETTRHEWTIESDIVYFSEPIEIEPPDSYIPLNEPDNSPAWTPTPTATRTPTPSLPPGDLQTFLSGLDEYDKMEIGEDIVVTFPLCERRAGFVIHQITIIYLPDGSSVAKEYRNDEFSLGKFNSHEAKTALTAILNDSNLVAELLEKTARPARCPAEIVDAMRAAFDAKPDYDKYVIDEDTVAFFPSCDGYPTDTHSHPFVINHFPTETAIGVAADGETHETVMIGTPNGRALLEELVAREKDLMTQLLAMAPKSERCESAD